MGVIRSGCGGRVSSKYFCQNGHPAGRPANLDPTDWMKGQDDQLRVDSGKKVGLFPDRRSPYKDCAKENQKPFIRSARQLKIGLSHTDG